MLGRCQVADGMVYQPVCPNNDVEMTSFIRDLLSRTISSISFFPVLSISLRRDRGMSSANSGVSWTGKKYIFYLFLDLVSLICHKFVHDFIKI